MDIKTATLSDEEEDFRAVRSAVTNWEEILPTLDPSIVREWILISPFHKKRPERYLSILCYLHEIEPKARYQPSFDLPKKNGGIRTIRPAERNLAIIQHLLRSWLLKNIPLGHDYCYNSAYFPKLGVLPAVSNHIGARNAVVLDLKDAFNHVNSATILKWLRYWVKYKYPKSHISDPVLANITDLATFEGITPQGCEATPYFYNLVLRPFDLALEYYCESLQLTYTRYSDNICISSNSKFPIDRTIKFAEDLARNSGFQLSWTDVYEGKPIQYLGTEISTILSITEEKDGEFGWTVMEALESKTPEIYRRRISGIWVWIHHIAGMNPPQHVFSKLEKYYAKVGNPPRTFREALQAKYSYKLFTD